MIHPVCKARPAPTPSNYARINRYDPTRTLAIRNRWVAEMGRRFAALRRLVWRAIVDEDCFGLTNPAGRVMVHADLTTRGRNAFDFPRLDEKVTAFMDWFRRQQDQGILEIMELPRLGQSLGDPWTNIYIKDSYSRGVQRARYELTGAGYPVPTLETTGGIIASLSTPFHSDRLAAVYLRAFDQLKGITAAMDTQISTILAQGLADGDNPNKIAKMLLDTIHYNPDSPYGLQIKDSLGRFIDGERRAVMLARTEVIRAHHLGSVQEYRQWAVAGVMVKAELVTAGDSRVCPVCLEIERESKGKPLTLDEVQNMIPVHPNCRCCIIPVPYREIH